MIRPPGGNGVAFTEAGDGDQRLDHQSHAAVATALDLPDDWASVRQVHGKVILRADEPGVVGEGDAVWSTASRLPLAVFTADCFGVVLHAPDAVGVAHAGWRGASAGLLSKLRAEMAASGYAPTRAAIGPGIGPCCFEVGDEVAAKFVGFTAKTSWGTLSVDLAGFIVSALAGLEVWTADWCTMHQPGWFSHRRDQATERLATIGWLP